MNGSIKDSIAAGLSGSRKQEDDTRRPVWLEATEAFYKKLNRIARECQLSRYEGAE